MSFAIHFAFNFTCWPIFLSFYFDFSTFLLVVSFVMNASVNFVLVHSDSCIRPSLCTSDQ